MRPSPETPAMVPLHSEVGPAMRQHPGPWRHLREAGVAMCIVLLANPFPTGGGLFWFQRH